MYSLRGLPRSFVCCLRFFSAEHSSCSCQPFVISLTTKMGNTKPKVNNRSLARAIDFGFHHSNTTGLAAV